MVLKRLPICNPEPSSSPHMSRPATFTFPPHAVLTTLLSLACSACTTAPPSSIQPPAPPSSVWHNAPSSTTQDWPTAGWWAQFGSPELTRVVHLTLHDNPEMDAAVARLQQAEALARQTRSALLPSVDASLGLSRSRSILSDGESESRSLHALGLQTSYELDLWRRIGNASAAATARARATAFDRDGIALTLAASTASAWLDTMTLHARDTLAKDNLLRAEQILALLVKRGRSGVATPLEIAQQQTLVANQRRQQAALAQGSADAQVRLAVLTGRPVAALPLEFVDPAQLTPPSIHAGLPAGLLTRRPDIARAEALLAAANADVAAARAALLPRLSLTASLTSAFENPSRLFDAPLYGLAGTLLAPVFNGGRLAAGRDAAVADQAALLASYRRTVIAALGDVERSLAALAGIERQRLAQAQELAAARRATVLSEARYRAGADSLIVLLDAQRNEFAARDTALQLVQARLQASLDLYKALGGGWHTPPSASPETISLLATPTT